MTWKKLGLIIKPSGELWWMKTHAMLPTLDYLENDVYRIYYSGRDIDNRSHIGYSDINIKMPFTILNSSLEPILPIGDLGCFDDSGLTPSYIVNSRDGKYLYYIGWNKKSTVRMSLVAGLAISKNKGVLFTKYSKSPILHRTEKEPLLIATAPCVLKIKNTWKMWYVSGVKWIDTEKAAYNIKYAESDDGINWKRDGTICIDFEDETEYAIARPCVLYEDDKYHMWFSHRGDTYKIGYAFSLDGINWQRSNRYAFEDLSDEGWDSEMIEYSYVIKHEENLYMFYNGNAFGKTGIGLAVWED